MAAAVSIAPGTTLLEPPRALTAFVLHDTSNQAFDLTRLRGRWSFLFFGYTHCRDVCPTTLTTLKQLHGLAGGIAQGVQYVFVSVDPQRDSTGVLARYVAHFNSEFVGVTGDDNGLGALTRQMGVYFEPHAPGPDEDYEVDHSAAIFLIDPQARLRAVFSASENARAMARSFLAVRAGQ